MSTIRTRNYAVQDLFTPTNSSVMKAKQASRSGTDPLSSVTTPNLTRAQMPDTERSIEEKFAEARKAAEELVATSFIKPVLQQVRDSNNAPAPFGPTQAEKQFGSLLDNQLADEIVQASQFPIVDRIVENFTRHLGQPQTTGLDINA
ncbi:MAG: rod-binding protein [Phycisphaerales bacterium JB052]